MLTSTPAFFFDYVDPYSYLMEWRLRELGGKVQDVLRVPLQAGARRRGWRLLVGSPWEDRWTLTIRSNAARALAMVAPSGVPDSGKAMELAIQARAHGRFTEVHEAVFRAYQSAGRDIGRIDVLVEIAVASGLDRSETKVVLDTDRHRRGLHEIAMDAERRGIRGVPTIAAGGRRLEGLHDTEAISSLLAS